MSDKPMTYLEWRENKVTEDNDKPMTVEDIIDLLNARKLEYYHMIMRYPPWAEMSPKEREEQISVRGGEIAINWLLEKIG